MNIESFAGPSEQTPAALGLGDVFPPEAIVFGLEARSRTAAIAELVHCAAALGRVAPGAVDGIIGLIDERERFGSTGLGNGIAFPHCRSAHTDRFAGVAGFASTGIPFEAIDGEPVDTWFLLLAPRGRPSEFYELLGRLVAIGRDRTLRFLLRGCRTPTQVSSFLRELDQPPPWDSGSVPNPGFGASTARWMARSSRH